MSEHELQMLRVRVKQLDALLSEPHPGIFHWHNAVDRLLKEITRYSQGKRAV